MLTNTSFEDLPKLLHTVVTLPTGKGPDPAARKRSPFRWRPSMKTSRTGRRAEACCESAYSCPCAIYTVSTALGS